MAQITVDQHGVGPDASSVPPAAGAAPGASGTSGTSDRADRAGHERLRSVLPAAIAVGLLLGVVVVGGVLLRDLLDFGLWFLGQGS